MSLGVALQSVFYYVVACSACHKVSYRRRRKREAMQAKREKGRIETEEPGLYRHPSPFSTNVYWREELALGPGPPQKKSGKSDKSSQRQLLTGSSVGSSTGGSPGRGTTSAEMQSTAEEALTGDNWNRRRYQREDEELWGHDLLPAARPQKRRGSNVGSSIGLVGIGHKDKVQPESYYTARNPPVNELHPPVVSTHPANKSETRWMLQPPPSAKIMSGKERANLSRSDSGGSRRGPELALGRRVGERLMEEKVRRAQWSGQVTPSRQSGSFKGKTGASTGGGGRSPEGQPHDRDPRPSSESTASRSGRRKNRPPPVSVSDDGIDPLDISERADGEPFETISKETLSRAGKQASAAGSQPLQELTAPSNALNTRSSSPNQAAWLGKHHSYHDAPPHQFPGTDGYAWSDGEATAGVRSLQRRSMDI